MTKAMSVQVKQCVLRSNPTFLGSVVTKLEYGDKVAVDKEQNSWIKVSPAGGQTGWVHVSALSEKEIILNPDSRDIEAAASSDEIALAGKGFNQQVEEKFRLDNQNIDFTWIDRMEDIVASQNDIRDFISHGGLSLKGGV